jgi:anti-sigma factor RsiW
MRCDFDTLCAYLNDGLNTKRRSEVDAHLRECEICFEAVTVMSAERGATNQQPLYLPGDESTVYRKYV